MPGGRSIECSCGSSPSPLKFPFLTFSATLSLSSSVLKTPAMWFTLRDQKGRTARSETTLRLMMRRKSIRGVEETEVGDVLGPRGADSEGGREGGRAVGGGWLNWVGLPYHEVFRLVFCLLWCSPPPSPSPSCLSSCGPPCVSSHSSHSPSITILSTSNILDLGTTVLTS